MDTSAPTLPAEHDATVEFRLDIRVGLDRGWRARVTGGDAASREFATPFDLARFVGWPLPAPGAT